MTEGIVDAAPSRREWMGLAVLAAGLGMIVLDGTIVGVAMPDIIRDLTLDLTDAQWVSSLYAVLLAALLLSTGKLADRFGRKLLFLLGILVFVGGSVWAAASTTGGALISARRAGRRCRVHHAVDALDGERRLPGPLPRRRLRGVGRGHLGRRSDRPARGRRAHPVRLVAVGVPGEPAAGRGCLRARAVGRARDARAGFRRGADVDGALLSAIGFGSLVFAVIEGPDLGWWTPRPTS
jgi:hypothetical protein